MFVFSVLPCALPAIPIQAMIQGYHAYTFQGHITGLPVTFPLLGLFYAVSFGLFCLCVLPNQKLPWRSRLSETTFRGASDFSTHGFAKAFGRLKDTRAIASNPNPSGDNRGWVSFFPSNAFMLSPGRYARSTAAKR